MITSPILAFWLSFGVSASLAYPIYRMLLAMKSHQTIDPFAPETHQKKQGTPTMGGLIILAGLIAGLIFTQTDHSMLVACMAFALIGFVDDFVVPRMKAKKRGLGWKQKILMQLVAAIGAAMLIPQFAGDWKMIGLAAFFVLFFSNAYNFLDGLDGLAGGVLVVLGLWFASNSLGSPVGWILIAASLPFLFLNAPPAKIFMGDVGSLPIGAVLGLLNVNWLFAPERFGAPIWLSATALAVLNIVLILELVLVPIQVGYYKRTQKRLFPATPIHHGFEKIGWPESRVVWSFILAQAICCMAASSIIQLSIENRVVSTKMTSVAEDSSPE